MLNRQCVPVLVVRHLTKFCVRRYSAQCGRPGGPPKMSKTLRKVLEQTTSKNDMLQVDQAKLAGFFTSGNYQDYFGHLANPHALDTKIKRLIEAARKKRAGSARNAFLDAPLDGSAAVPEAVTAGVVAPIPATGQMEVHASSRVTLANRRGSQQ